MKALKIKCINSLKPLIYVVIYFLYYTKFITEKPLIYCFCNCIYYFNKTKRIRAIRNLQNALNMGKERAQRLYKQSLYIIISNVMSFAFIIAGLLKQKGLNNLLIRGATNLDKLVNTNSGAIAISGHIGNFPLMVIGLASKGYPVSLIFKESKYFGGNFFKKVLSFYNVTPIPYTNNSYDMFQLINRSIKKGEIIFFFIDQKGKNSTNVKFFNKDMSTFYGPVIFARRTGAPILPIFTHFDGSKHIIDVYKPFNLSKGDMNTTEKIQFIIRIIESYIKEHPDNWNWTYYKWD